MGEKTVEVTQKLRYAIALVADLEARQVHDGDAGPLLEHLDEQLRVALAYEDSWAFFAHGNQMETTSAFLAFSREWYAWTKRVQALTTAVQLSPEDLRDLVSLEAEGPDATMVQSEGGRREKSAGARDAAMTPAIDRIEEGLHDASVDDYFVLVLRACLWGGGCALQAFGDLVDDPAAEFDEGPILDLAVSMSDGDAAERALRAIHWVLAARLLTKAWPDRWAEVLDVARSAMPVSDRDFCRIHELAAFTAEEFDPIDDDDPRDLDDVIAGRRVSFAFLSLAVVVDAVTGQWPGDTDSLLAIGLWRNSLAVGEDAVYERLEELKADHPEVVPR